jgi:hypothetical protein
MTTTGQDAGKIPEGFMIGDEFECRVKERVTAFYRENGLVTGDATGAVAYIRRAKAPLCPDAPLLCPDAPPEGFMTGDEFESRVKDELKQLYAENGLL